MSTVGVLESHVSIDVHIDRKVHPRLIGARGKSIMKVMSDYQVRVVFLPMLVLISFDCMCVTLTPPKT